MYLRVTAASVHTNGVQISWSGGVQARQYLQKSTGLNGTNVWINLLTNQPPTMISGSYLDVPSTTKANFYRIRVERP